MVISFILNFVGHNFEKNRTELLQAPTPALCSSFMEGDPYPLGVVIPLDPLSLRVRVPPLQYHPAVGQHADEPTTHVDAWFDLIRIDG